MIKMLLAAFAVAAAACAPVTAEPVSSEPAEIVLTRSVCYGFCPAYSVTITSTGEVSYVGRAFVNVVGEAHAQIAPEEVARLLARFDEIGFERLQDRYRAGVTDLPTFTVTLRRGGRSKTVLDYGGRMAGMPEAVRALQDEIDRVAGTSRWVLRDGEPVRTRPSP